MVHEWLPTWVRPARAERRKPPRWLLLTGIAWIFCLSAWMVVGIALVAAAPADGGAVVRAQVRSDLEVMAGLAVFAVVATVVWGAMVGRRHEYRWLWLAGAVGTGVLMLGYVLAMLAAPMNGTADNDNAAGAGVAILILPTAAAVLSLLWFGAGIGLLSRLIIRSRS